MQAVQVADCLPRRLLPPADERMPGRSKSELFLRGVSDVLRDVLGTAEQGFGDYEREDGTGGLTI